MKPELEAASTPATNKAPDQPLRNVDHPFTRKGLKSFKETVDDFIVSLAEESARTTTRRKGDAIDRSDVQNAASYLYSGSRRRAAGYLGTVGGVVLGIAGSSAISLYSADAPDQLGILITVVLSLIGAGLVAWSAASNIARR